MPDREAAGKDALSSTPVEGGECRSGEVSSLHPAQEVKACLCFLDQGGGVGGPCEVVCDVHSQKLCAFHRLHGTAIDCEWGVCRVLFPEVHGYFFCFVDIEL